MRAFTARFLVKVASPLEAALKNMPPAPTAQKQPPWERDIRVDYLRSETGRPLPLLGHGSARCVYEIDSGRVLKLGFEGDGARQNKGEFRVFTQSNHDPILARVYSHAPDFSWLISEKADPLQGAIPDVVDFAKNYGLRPDEVRRWPNWGSTPRGPVLVDYGE